MTTGADTALGLPLLLFQKLGIEWQDVQLQCSQYGKQYFGAAGLYLFPKCSLEVLLALVFIHFR
jgi:hypothetical protein